MSFRARSRGVRNSPHVFPTRRALAEQYALLRESEQQLRTAFDDAPVGMLVLDEHGVILKVNAVFCGYAKLAEEELLGTSYTDLAHPEDRENCALRFASLVEAGGGAAIERRFLTSDGEEVWALIHVSTLVHGSRTELLVHVLDVTDQRRMKLELEQRNTQLLDADRLKDELISVVSHDLRTPLTSIIGYLELALEDDGSDPLSAARRGYLDVARRNSQRLYRLVEDLLFVSRAQAGRASLELTQLDLAAVVREAVEAAKPNADAGSVTLSCRCDAEPAELVGDAHRLAEVVENLLSNAVKFTGERGRVDVVVAADAAEVVVRVSDTGRGIERADQQHLFKRFFRTQDSAGLPGAGLGLSIVKAIVDAHAGTVQVASSTGAGTTFEVRLPRSGPPASVAVPA